MPVNNVIAAVLVMAVVTYLIRVLPLVFIRREIKNRTVRSFLYYVPYVTLSVMTVPAILTSTAVIWSGVAALAVSAILALCGAKLPVVAAAACTLVYIVELFF